MKYHLNNFKKTSLDNIFEYIPENGKHTFYDFSQLKALDTHKINGDNYIRIEQETQDGVKFNTSVPINKLAYHRFYDVLPNGFRRLTKYGIHTFYNRLYYYNNITNEIIVQKTNSKRGTHFLTLIPSTYNNRVGYTINTDTDKAIVCFPQLIVTSLQ